MYTTPPGGGAAAAAAAAAQDAAIQANALALANITGQYIGLSATFAGLPVTPDTTDGDWAKLTADDIGTGTELDPQYPQGAYRYDGSAYSFAFESGGSGSGNIPVATVAEMIKPSTWYELTAEDAPAQKGIYWVSASGEIFEGHGANNGSTGGASTLPEWQAGEELLKDHPRLIDGEIWISKTSRTTAASLDAAELANWQQVSWQAAPELASQGNAGGSFETVGTVSPVGTWFTNANNATDIFHIKLPYGVGKKVGMYRLTATGFAYGAPQNSGDNNIDISWMGYVYTTSWIKTQTVIRDSNNITAGQYQGSDGYVYLWFKTPGVYYNSWRLESMHVGNGGVLAPSDIVITQSPAAQL